MPGFFSVRVAPGLRLSASTRGVRAHVGPRSARLHVGGGGTGVSTGAGPVTFYQSVGGGSGRRPHQTGASSSQIAAAAKLEQAKLILGRLQAIEHLPRQEFAAPTKALAALPPLPPFERLLKDAERRELNGIGFFARGQRKGARARARVLAEEHARVLLAEAHSEREATQELVDAEWRAFLDNDEHLVVAALQRAFADNDAPAAALGVSGDELSLAVMVPSLDETPDRMPSTTAAGNLSLRKMSKSNRNGVYLSLLAGHVVLSVKEALAAAPGLESVRVIALRADVDHNGLERVVPLMGTRLTRSAMAGVQWEDARAWDVIRQIGSETLVKLKGSSSELVPLDLSMQPQLSALISSIEFPTGEGPGSR